MLNTLEGRDAQTNTGVHFDITTRIRKLLPLLPENATPPDIVMRLISGLYTARLTRDVQRDILQLLGDEKSIQAPVLYVPAGDEHARTIWERLFTSLAIPKPEIREYPSPDGLNEHHIGELQTSSGLLTLAHDGEKFLTYIVPGGRFGEIYGWDTFFISLGLLADESCENKALVRNHIEHQYYQIIHYGRVLNGNRAYYTRHNPPFFPTLIKKYWKSLSPEEQEKETPWMQKMLLGAVLEYKREWTSSDIVSDIGLARYYDKARGFVIETEPGHFDVLIKPHADAAGMTVTEYMIAYNSGKIENPALDEEAMHDRSCRATGHDTSNRLIGVSAHLNSVDLNSLLYQYESDIASLLDMCFDGQLQSESSTAWRQKAEVRKERMNQHLYNAEDGVFHDYNFIKKAQAPYANATSLYPLYAKLATQEQAESIIRTLLPKLECAGGVAASSEASRGPVTPDRPQRQWDYPLGWAPHQMITWDGLLHYATPENGFYGIVQRLIYKWLYMISRDCIENEGAIAEKYDVVRCTSRVEVEYGNVGAGDTFENGAGFGWTNASYTRGWMLLNDTFREKLRNMEPPEQVFANIIAS